MKPLISPPLRHNSMLRASASTTKSPTIYRLCAPKFPPGACPNSLRVFTPTPRGLTSTTWESYLPIPASSPQPLARAPNSPPLPHKRLQFYPRPHASFPRDLPLPPLPATTPTPSFISRGSFTYNSGMVNSTLPRIAHKGGGKRRHTQASGCERSKSKRMGRNNREPRKTKPKKNRKHV